MKKRLYRLVYGDVLYGVRLPLRLTTPVIPEVRLYFPSGTAVSPAF